jgi:hypothetical protein
MIAGLIWGIWSATRIKPAQAEPVSTALQPAAPQVHAHAVTLAVKQTAASPAGNEGSSEPPDVAAQ